MKTQADLAKTQADLDLEEVANVRELVGSALCELFSDLRDKLVKKKKKKKKK